MESRRHSTFLAFFALLIVIPCAAQTNAKPVYLDPSQPIDSRVDDLIKRMTLERRPNNW